MPIAEEICDSMQVTLLKNYNLRKLITDIWKKQWMHAWGLTI
jgi:hypothetical protein